MHFHHGPIDLVIDAEGTGAREALHLAATRFRALLQELADELPLLRSPAMEDCRCKGPVARAMERAVRPHLPGFITPMAAVAGAVADEILSVMASVGGLGKASINNGGDIAFRLMPGESLTAAIAGVSGGRLVLSHGQPWRGIATSGWRGRSHSLGIADAVTVFARSAADADAAATMIANAVDLPGHRAIEREAARTLFPDTDLGDRLVTTGVGVLSRAEIDLALERGAAPARQLVARGVIGGALLCLMGQTRTAGDCPASLPETRLPENQDA
ncbi:MAG: UPF0280 family protein [Brucellaceae bacterium]|nr:UPF0280 family protein [Notoacmeibacter sp.]MCC0027911.1 UPF0280 family protein [Brucellaceae bacterium]